MTTHTLTREELEHAQTQMADKTLPEQLQAVATMWSDLNGFPAEQARMIKACGFWSIGVFAFEYFPEYITTPFGKHHQPMFEAIPRGSRGIHTNIAAPRGSAKSTNMAVIYPTHALFYKEAYETLEMPPYRFILIISKSATMAESRVWDIQRKIDGDERFRYLRSEERWGVKRILTSNGILVAPNSRGGQVRGSLFGSIRPELIITDDLDDPETVNNPDVRHKDQLWFDSDLLYAGDLEKTTNFINIDTIKHPESVASLLRQRPKWNNLLFRAIEQPADLWHPTAEERWQTWEKIYNDLNLTLTERHTQARTFFEEHETEMMAGVEHLWEEAITYYQVRQEICDKGYFPVLRELQNSTRDPSRALFDMDGALRFETVAEGFLRSDKVLVQWQEMSGATIFLDWAGGKDIVDNAFAAVVAVVWVPMPGSRHETVNSIMDGVHGYVVGADVRRIGMSQQISACFEMYDMLKSLIQSRNFTIRLGIEGFVQDTWEAQRDVIERDFFAQRDARNVKGLHIEWLPRLTNKFDRIDALQPLIRNGWLGFARGLPAEFMKQMSLYPTGDFVDGPDALEGACQLRIRQFQSEREERRKVSRQRNKDFRVKL